MPLDSFPDAGEIRFQKVRDAGGVLNATFAFLRRNAREVFVGFLAIVGPAALAAGLSSALYLRSMGGLFTMDPEEMAALDPGDLFGVSYLGVALFGMLTTIVALAAAGAYVRLYREGEAGGITAGLLWEETKGLLLPMAGFTLALIGVFIGSAVVMVIPCLGALAVLAFYVWMVPYVSVTYAARVVEEPTLGAAYRRARTLVKGTWKFAAGSMVLAWIIVIVVIMALSIPGYIVAAVIGASAADPSGLSGSLGLIAAPLQVLNAVAYLVPFVAAFFVHGRLVEETEGTSLVDGLDAFADPSPASHWDAAPRSTPPEPLSPPASGPQGEADEPEDDRSRGFRGGGFGGA